MKLANIKKRSIQGLTWLMPLFILISCGGTKVSRVDENSTMDLSGEWNDTDSRLVSGEMIEDCLSRPWYHKYFSSKTTPTVIVGKIRNKSHEHINTETFTKDIERALINSGKVEFVASKEERDQLRDEKADMAQNASAQSAKSSGEEQGADLMLIGSINSIIDKEGNKSVKFYQINMELIEIESSKKVWIGEKKIKKYVKKSRASM